MIGGIETETKKLTRRELNKVKCRERIIKASRRLFKVKGYENTLIDEIVFKAEVSKATFYNYFSNKESLLDGIAEDEMDDVEKNLNQIRELYNGEQLILLVLKKVIVDVAGYVDLSRKILYLDTRSDSLTYDFCSTLQSIFEDLVKTAQQQDIFKNDIASVDIARIIMGIYYQALFGWPDLDSIGEEECNHRVDHLLSLVFCSFYKK